MGLRRRPGAGRRLDGSGDRRHCVAGRRRPHDEPTSGSPPTCGPEGRSRCRRTHRQIGRRPPRGVPTDREGTASLFGVRLPAARVTAAFERVDAFARGAKHDGDGRTMDQLRADAFLDLLEGVDIGSSPVHRSGVVELTVPWTTATGATNDPGVLAGYGPIDADTARDIIANDVARLSTTSGRCERMRWRHTLTDDGGRLLKTTLPPIPGRATRPTRFVAPERGSGPTADAESVPAAHPPAEDAPTRRTPCAALAAWIAARDRTCRAPGCRVPARAADIDHTIDHAAGGLTSHDNLAILCRHHHRLKHEGGWQVNQPEPGMLFWTSPSGREYARAGPSVAPRNSTPLESGREI
jgi:Domain of unknown function (DUF222)/HNH endonuclease